MKQRTSLQLEIPMIALVFAGSVYGDDKKGINPASIKANIALRYTRRGLEWKNELRSMLHSKPYAGRAPLFHNRFPGAAGTGTEVMRQPYPRLINDQAKETEAGQHDQ
jgi:hypothetical protein